MKRIISLVSGTLLAVAGAGCSFTPPGTSDEREKLAGESTRFAYELPFQKRHLPEISSEPTWKQVLFRAFMANGDLEAAYFQWKAALERVDEASAWPNSNLMIGYSVALGPSNMKSFDRMTFSGGVDTMENLSFPVKVKASGKIALDKARAVGERFRAAKFDLQRQVLSTWADYVSLIEQTRIQREQLSLAQVTLDAASSRLQAGGTQADILNAEISLRMAEDALKSVDAGLSATRAVLNGFMSRSPDSLLPLPLSTLSLRAVPADDSVLLSAGVERNPELASSVHEVQGRADALERARLEWIPDINPSIAFTGGIEQVIGASLVLPTAIRKIKSGIREAEADLKASEATLRQARQNKAALFVGTLVALRDAERKTRLFESEILPRTTQLVENLRDRFSVGSASFLEFLDSQRTLLDVRRVIAETRATHEKRLAELEALMGTDIETFLHG